MYLASFFAINPVNQALVTFSFLTRPHLTNNPAYVLSWPCFSIRYLYRFYLLIIYGAWRGRYTHRRIANRTRRGIEHTDTLGNT